MCRKERRMNERVEYSQLDCYKRATDEQKRKLNQEQYFDLGKLPEETLRKEFENYIRYRGTKVSILTIKTERNYFNSLCEFLQKPSNQVKSLMERDENVWIKQLKAWMLQKGRALTKAKKRVYQNESVEKVALIRYFENIIQFTVDLSETNELTKDIWYLERLPIIIRSNPIVNHKTINFRKIEQPDIREEMKKAIYYHLQYEAIATVTREVSVMNKFSKYLKEKYPQVDSCEEIDRNIIEKFLIYLKIEVESGNGKRDDLIKLIDADVLRQEISYIDDNEHITEQYRADLENNALAPLAEELKTMTEGIHKLIQSIFNDKILEDMIGNGNETTVPSNDLNENFAKKEFQTLWNYINHKYAYTVDFDSNELIKKAIEHIDRELFVSQLQYTVSKSEQRDVMDAMMVRESNSFYEAKSSTTILKHSETSQIKYDLIGKIAEGTVLTRKTVAAILQGISPIKFAMFKNNPEEFITKVIRLIKEQKATMIVEHISYDQIEGKYDSSIFTAEKHASFDKAYRAKKHIQDYVFTDGTAEKSVERRFAEELDGAKEVCVYAKLPKGFAIPTPVGSYSPDWAIAFYEGTVKHIYFIAETKGTMESLELRPIEKAKISCARKLFNEISTENVVYHDVDSYQNLLNIMNSIEK